MRRTLGSFTLWHTPFSPLRSLAFTTVAVMASRMLPPPLPARSDPHYAEMSVFFCQRCVRNLMVLEEPCNGSLESKCDRCRKYHKHCEPVCIASPVFNLRLTCDKAPQALHGRVDRLLSRAHAYSNMSEAERQERERQIGEEEAPEAHRMVRSANAILGTSRGHRRVTL